ncbi:MAG TPA: hypothetical protein VGP30_01455, partial [Candidatus Limnocylindrales bacterium]|nr:hypothetical protein [Candidatus Limnocylindrales bacterium]
MAAIWAVGEVADGRPTRLTLELATLARQLAEAAGGRATAVLIGAGATDAANEVAAHGADVLVVAVGRTAGPAASLV